MLYPFAKITKIGFSKLIWQCFATIARMPFKLNLYPNDSIRMFLISWSIGTMFYSIVIGGHYLLSIKHLKINTIDTIDDLNRAIIDRTITFYYSKTDILYIKVRQTFKDYWNYHYPGIFTYQNADDILIEKLFEHATFVENLTQQERIRKIEECLNYCGTLASSNYLVNHLTQNNFNSFYIPKTTAQTTVYKYWLGIALQKNSPFYNLFNTL